VSFTSDTLNYQIENNICVDPMFGDTIDYLLQAGSPCIDLGDPSILDIDGSGSDIGPWGGPNGKNYSYVDLAPSAPSDFGGEMNEGRINLQWRKNGEADLDHYSIYSASELGGTSELLGTIADWPDGLFKPSYLDTGFITYADSSFTRESAYYSVVAVDQNLNESEPTDEIEFVVTAADEQLSTPLPQRFQLFQNSPNPFNASTSIAYFIPGNESRQVSVQIAIYNMLGQRVRVLIDGPQSPGARSVVWDGRDDAGSDVASGVYFYKLTATGVDYVQSRKMVLLK